MIDLIINVNTIIVVEILFANVSPLSLKNFPDLPFPFYSFFASCLSGFLFP